MNKMGENPLPPWTPNMAKLPANTNMKACADMSVLQET
jgi:hypothetical protein